MFDDLIFLGLNNQELDESSNDIAENHIYYLNISAIKKTSDIREIVLK